MKKKVFKAVLSIAVITGSFFSQAQERRVIFGKPISNEYINPNTGKIQCISYQYSEYLQEQNRENSVFKEPQKQAKAQGTNEIYVVPVVVHVIHNGEAVGVGKNISDARVLSQITVLNEDYRKVFGTAGYSTNPLGVDTEIEFCLAQVDPLGNTTTGINRVDLGNYTWNESNVESILKPLTQWDPTKYFNIWVCEFGGDLDEVLGYAQFPSNSTLGGIPSWGGNASTDGVIIDWRCFGRNTEAPGIYFWGYDKGRTTTHEVGHALGLRHIWGDNNSCTVNTTDTFQDYCPDTPPHADANYSCSAAWYTICSGYTPMPENYMDYGSDNCLNTFTPNQKTRMRTVLENATRRASLLTSNVCQASASTDKFGLGMISMYPNPANEVINLFVPDNYKLAGKIIIYNTLGQTVFSSDISETNSYSIDVSNFQAGVYFIKINRENQSKTLQFIKK